MCGMHECMWVWMHDMYECMACTNACNYECMWVWMHVSMNAWHIWMHVSMNAWHVWMRGMYECMYISMNAYIRMNPWHAWMLALALSRTHTHTTCDHTHHHTCVHHQEWETGWSGEGLLWEDRCSVCDEIGHDNNACVNTTDVWYT